METTATATLSLGRTWPRVITVTLLLATLGPVCWGADIKDPPTNTSGFLGEEASFLCSLSGPQPQVETFTWGKSYPLPFKTISSNNDSTDDVKYRITDRYRLTIVKLTLKDEGTYRCRMKNQEYEASLTVLVRPSSVKLAWPRDRDWVKKGAKSRLTCSVKQSRPRATFRWFLATKDITSQAVSPNPTSTSKTGYTDCHSYLDLTLTDSSLGDIYTCTVDLPGEPGVKSVQLAVKFSSGERPLAGYVGVAVLALFASLRSVTT